MLEQTVNILTQVFEKHLLINKLNVLVVASAIFILSGCMPMGDQEVNTSLFKNKEEMQARTAELKPGMSKEAVFERIKISPEKFSKMSLQEVQASVYGNSQVSGTPEQLEQFRKKLMAYEGYSLPYREIKSSGSLGFGSMKVNKNGYDLKLVLVFERDRLLRASVDGNQSVNMDENEPLWGAVLKKTTGFGF